MVKRIQELSLYFRSLAACIKECFTVHADWKTAYERLQERITLERYSQLLQPAVGIFHPNEYLSRVFCLRGVVVTVENALRQAVRHELKGHRKQAHGVELQSHAPRYFRHSGKH